MRESNHYHNYVAGCVLSLTRALFFSRLVVSLTYLPATRAHDHARKHLVIKEKSHVILSD